MARSDAAAAAAAAAAQPPRRRPPAAPLLPPAASAVVTWYLKPWCLPGETMTDMYYPIYEEGLYRSLMQVRAHGCMGPHGRPMGRRKGRRRRTVSRHPRP
jgi:hypothetical protein